MNSKYDRHFQKENLFGEPYPELIEFFRAQRDRTKVLDLGCGQGRDAIAIARLGFEVTAIDNSEVGIQQMKQIAKIENLKIEGYVEDIYSINNYGDFDIILLDSMFHFAKKDKEKEIGLIEKILSTMKKNALLVICIQDTGSKVQTLSAVVEGSQIQKIEDRQFSYIFDDEASGHQSKTKYRLFAFTM